MQGSFRSSQEVTFKLANLKHEQITKCQSIQLTLSVLSFLTNWTELSTHLSFSNKENDFQRCCKYMRSQKMKKTLDNL